VGEFILRVFLLPLVGMLFTLPVLHILDVALTAGVLFTVWIIWLIVINGGFLILDGDLNLLD